MSVAIPDGRRDGWIFGNEFPGSTTDEAEGYTHLYQAYVQTQSDYTGIVSVPVLWDKKLHTIVNNESAEILRILNGAFNAFTDVATDLYPSALRQQIDSHNERIYRGLNNAVYRAGVATKQEAYEEAYAAVFDTLNWLEGLLGKSRFVNGAALTETDIRLCASLFRFDPVYYALFKCNKRMIAGYGNLTAYLRDIYQTPGVAETVDLRHIVTGYYSQKWNPSGVIPLGPDGYVSWLARPHRRERKFEEWFGS
jgi:putative glutathione S-transferase